MRTKEAEMYRAGERTAEAGRYVTVLGKGGPVMIEPLEQGLVVVRGGAQGFAQEITLGRHRLIADEPVSAGGADRGPGPYDLLLAALGA